MNEKDLRLTVEMTIIDNLGVKMYASFPRVIAEIVSNSWDADAKSVKITIPTGSINEKSEIIIGDDGFGMTYKEVNSAYLSVGRKKRIELGTDKTPKGRKVIGRKGIGNLSVFGVADEIIVETTSLGNKTIFTMNLEDIRKVPKGEDYYPPYKKEKTNLKEHYTIVKLKKLKREKAINLKYVRNYLIRMFSIIDKKFRVFLNNEEISPEERKSLVKIQYEWNIKEEIKENSGWIVSGKICTSEKPLDEDLIGIIVMARGKMIQQPTFFEVKGGKEHARSYMSGELHAEFFDAEEDLMATARNSILEESEQGRAFINWVRKKIKKISYDWSEKRRKEREKIIKQDPEFKEWIKGLKGTEKSTFNKAMKMIASDVSLSKQRIKSLARIVKDTIMYDAFKDLVEELDNTPFVEITKIIELLEEWDFLRAKEMLKLFEGHLATIEKLEYYIKSDAKEIPVIHNFFKEFPWVLDAKWTDYQDEKDYASLLRDEFPEDEKIPEENRRIDFLAIGFNDTLNIIELKRPGHALNKNDLRQIEDYVVFARSELLGTDPEMSYRSVSGIIICGKIQKSAEMRERLRNMENNRIYVRKYTELVSKARKLHQKYIDLYNEYEKKKFSQ